MNRYLTPPAPRAGINFSAGQEPSAAIGPETALELKSGASCPARFVRRLSLCERARPARIGSRKGMAHFIRLRDAWEIQPVVLPGGQAVLRFARRFGYSAGLKNASRIWLSIEDVPSPACVELNGNLLGRVLSSRDLENKNGQHCPARFDITSLLRGRNLLAIELTTCDSTTAGQQQDCLGLVRLEIE